MFQLLINQGVFQNVPRIIFFRHNRDTASAHFMLNLCFRTIIDETVIKF